MEKLPKKRWVRLIRGGMLLLGLYACLPAPDANANYFSDLYNGLQKFSELPGEVSQLQESYQQTIDDLQQTKDELGETKDQLGQTLSEVELYRAQNETLTEQNRQLSLVVEELKQERTARENYYNRIKVTVLTGLGLILGYFLLIRLLRFAMRSRSRRSDRVR